MSSKVEVLCPNGHRITVKTTPNSKLLYVLEEACKKKGFDPPEDYLLKHGRKDLDLSLTIRYAGLANNAKLELVKAPKSRQEIGKATIALQLQDGRRLQEELASSLSLWELLRHWESKSDSDLCGGLTQHVEGVHPVCVYMQEEIIGELALKETSLKTLGLTSGRAVIRFLHRPVDDNILEEIKLKIMTQKEKSSKLHHTSSTPVSLPPDSSVSTDSMQTEEVMNPNEVKDNNQAEPMEIEGDSANQSAAFPSAHTVDVQSTEHEMQPTGQHQVKPEGQRSKVNIPGVQIFRPGEAPLSAAERLQLAQYLAQSQPLPLPAVQQQDFSNFKFPEETKGQALYHNELQESKPEDYKPCDRETVVYNVNKTGPAVVSTDAEDLPDEFFEITEEDLRKLWADQQKKMALQADQPLMTKSMRQALKEERLSHYSRVIIRFHFPEKVILQAVFRPRETVFALHKFVKKCLDDSNIQFYLYTTPPKQVLDDKSSTLIQANLVPMSVVYFGSDTAKEFYLSKEILQNMVTEREAVNVMMKHMAPMGEGATDSHNQSASSSTLSSSSSSSKRTTVSQGGSSQRESSQSASSGSNVPKWFRVGKK